MRYIAVVLVLTALSLSIPSSRVAAQAATVAPSRAVAGVTVLTPNQVSIGGIVVTPTGQPLANTIVRARNLLTERIGGSTITTGSGHFSIARLSPGDYVLEAVDATGQVIGTSPFIFAAAGTTVTATVTATSSVSSLTGIAATLSTTAAQSVKYAAAAAGVAGLMTPVGVKTASPSR